MNLKQTYILLAIGLFFSSCDLGKFTGAKTDAEPIPDTARIIGAIVNRFSEEPVVNASVRVRDQAAFTDAEGNYILFYHLQADDQRDQSLPIRVSASRFIPLDTTLVAYPDNRLNVRLSYGAPTIQAVTRIGTICQVTVQDFQGADDVIKASAFFSYIRAGERAPSAVIEVGLQKFESDSSDIAWFQGDVQTSIPEYGDIMSSFRVQVQDRMAFTDSTSYAEKGIDSLLFPTQKK